MICSPPRYHFCPLPGVPTAPPHPNGQESTYISCFMSSTSSVMYSVSVPPPPSGWHGVYVLGASYSCIQLVAGLRSAGTWSEVSWCLVYSQLVPGLTSAGTWSEVSWYLV